MANLERRSFSLEASSLFKAEAGGKGIATIEGILSTQTRDTKDESVIIKGMDITPLNTGYAQINWWHLGRKDPKMVIGLIDWAKKTKNDTVVEFSGHLLNTESGQAALELMRALESEGKSIGVSVEGSIISKNNGNIYRSIATGAALATDQINKECTANLCKALLDGGYVLDETLGWQDLVKAVSVEGDAIYGQSPLVAPSLAYDLEEAIAELHKEYPDLSEEFLRKLLLTINQRNNE